MKALFHKEAELLDCGLLEGTGEVDQDDRLEFVLTVVQESLKHLLQFGRSNRTLHNHEMLHLTCQLTFNQF